MNRDERDEQIWLYAAGALSDAEMQTVRELLEAGDAADLASLSAARETLARLPEALDPVPPSPLVLQKLMARVDDSSGRADATPDRTMTSHPPVARRRRWPVLLAAAAACVAVVSLLNARHWKAQATQMQEQQDQALAALEAMRTQSARDLQQLKSEMDAQKVASAKQMDALLAQSRLLFTPNLQLTSLEGQNLPKGGGRVLWDKDNRKSHVFVFNLAPPAKGNVYELWFIEAGENKAPVPAGTFTVDANGNGRLESPIPPGMDNIAVAAITEEPAGGSQQPTMPIKLVGKVQAQ